MTKQDINALIAHLVQVALDEVGHAYRFGGVPGKWFLDPWDCSSYVNSMWGGFGGQAIPGYPAGTYDGSQHGPSTIGWLNWQGQGVGSIDRALCSAGDIPCWRTHMGFAISNTEMISAQTPQAGTQKSGIDGFIQGEALTILRMTIVGPGGITLPIPPIGSSHAVEAVARGVAQSSKALVYQRLRIRGINMPAGRS
jgi:hypothetical protein